ncbi:unnamed protein product [Alternaria burnsii]|nr:unnamed protein product [Alternaria burnsii]
MSCSTLTQVVPIGCRKVVIEGLGSLQHLDQVSEGETKAERPASPSFSMIIHDDEPISELWNRIEEHGFQKPLELIIDDIHYREDTHRYVVSNHDEVIVVTDDQISTKNTIRLTESLISHANTHHGPSIDFNITPLSSSQCAVDTSCGFHVSFERTPRMPDDNRLHQLPGSLGSYDLFSVQAYSNRLPKSISESGGVFFPMWQREAMWLNFKPKQHKWAVHVFMGHVNTISGRTIEETANKEVEDQQQDYIVIPGQPWLDGICVAPGVVRQFVAMPLGSGYTVEGQKTSKEQYGGLQLEITPELFPKQRLWSYGKDKHIVKSVRGFPSGLDEMKTPEQLGRNIGDVLRSYPVDSIYEEPLKIRHLAKPGSYITCRVIAQMRFATLQPIRLSPSYSSCVRCDTNSGSLGQLPMAPIKDTSEIRSESAPDGLLPEQVTEFSSKTESLDYSSEDNTKRELEVNDARDISAMGLAAGGKLIQDIYKDPYPATLWNHSAARVLHVHILDPVSCEKVTHIVPRPPSMDAKAYTEASGQFFVVKEKVDERLDGGDFDNVKSVSQMDQQVGISTEPEFDPTKPKMCTTCELRLCDCM